MVTVSSLFTCSSFELPTVNLAGKVRSARLGGRDFLVAPLRLLVPSVLNGSKGPLYYPPDEIGRNPSAWNGMPIVVNHPSHNGSPISARSPAILDLYGIGQVFETVYNGRLDAEGWFDIEKTRRIEPRILAALEANKQIELSTGLFTDNEPRSGVHNGKAYSFVARNYRPDHLAILPDTIGACSVLDGCGVLVNEEGGMVFNESNGQQTGMHKKCKGGEDCDCDKHDPECKNNGDFLKKRKDKGMPLTPEQKKGLVDNLVGNCDCSKGEKPVDNGPFIEADREGLLSLSDDRLQRMEQNRATAAADAVVANAARKTPPVPTNVVTKPAPVANEGTPPPAKPLTEADWLAAAPAGIRSVVQNAMNFEASQKTALIEKITANSRNVFSKEYLATQNLDALQGIAALAESSTPAQVSIFQPHYGGQAAPIGNALPRGFANEDLDMATPVVNWSDKKTA